jgi:hypothetical protein
MTVTLADFQAYVGTEETTFPQACLDTATSLVSRYIGEATIPSAVLNQALLVVASEVYHRRSAPNGIAQFASMDGSPVRVAKDPMNPAYAILKPYVGWAV